MAKKKPVKSNDSRLAYKKARTESNTARRRVKHAKRTRALLPHPKRGLARAMRRWCESVSRTSPVPVVLTSNTNLASLVRVRREKRKSDNHNLGLRINGQVMGSMAEAVWTVRNLAESAKQRQAENVAAS